MRRPALLLCMIALAARADGPVVPLGRIAAPAEGGQPAPLFTGRIRPFRVQTGYLLETPWLDGDDPSAAPDPGPDWMTLSLGNDNPSFGFRRRGDPGGVGFTRLASQVQLFDTAQTSMALCVNAVAPAGVQNDGLPDSRGATVFMPAFSLFHALDDATGLLLSVGTNLTLPGPATAQTQTQTQTRRDLQYGVALYRAVDADPAGLFHNVYLSVEALGQQRDARDQRGPVTWELLPGLHWQPAPNWAVSGGFAMPMAARGDPWQQPTQQWQIRCTIQF